MFEEVLVLCGHHGLKDNLRNLCVGDDDAVFALKGQLVGRDIGVTFEFDFGGADVGGFDEIFKIIAGQFDVAGERPENSDRSTGHDGQNKQEAPETPDGVSTPVS
jgi:hypothetical protein